MVVNSLHGQQLTLWLMGLWDQLTAGSAGSGTVLNTTNYASGPSAANPVLTKNDDSTNGDVTVRQNAVGLSVADEQQVKLLLLFLGHQVI